MRSVAGLTNPIYLAVDEMDNLWVIDNSLQSIETYDMFGYYPAVQSSSPGFNVYGIAERGGYLFFGIDTGGQINVQLATFLTSDMLANKVNYRLPTTLPSPAAAVAFDSKKVQWVVANDGTVYSSTDFVNFKKMFQVPYLPAGMAVDAAHKHIFFSHNVDNSVDVYTTAGTLVTTIQ